MKKTIFTIAILAATAAQAQLAASAGSTNIVITSETMDEPAWKRQVVMKSGATGKIFNDSGKVGDAAESAATGELAELAGQIGDAAHTAMTNALQTLVDASAHAATNAIALAIAIRPEASRTNLTGYVVKTVSDGTNDTQYVWYNHDLAFPPNRFVAYETYGQATTNKVTWTDWTNAVTVVENGKTWQGCRVCTVTRPAWAQGEPCLDFPNETWGGPTGFDFGDMTITVAGDTPYTGFVTNGATGAVLYFDQGINKGNPLEETE